MKAAKQAGSHALAAAAIEHEVSCEEHEIVKIIALGLRRPGEAM